MVQWVCSVCGHIHTGDSAPDNCPVCKSPKEKFKKLEEGAVYFAAEHVLGVAKNAEDDIKNDLAACLKNESEEVVRYLAMSRSAEREGYPGIAGVFKRFAEEKAETAAKLCELLGTGVSASTKENLTACAEAEKENCAKKMNIAMVSKQRNYDPIHDTTHEMARDAARYSQSFAGLLKRNF